jgi:hypothetical protein
MGRIVLRVEGILPDDPEIAYDVNPEDAGHIIWAFGRMYGPYLQDDDPPRERTPREILRRMVDDWMAEVQAKTQAEWLRAVEEVLVPPSITIAATDPSA